MPSHLRIAGALGGLMLILFSTAVAAEPAADSASRLQEIVESYYDEFLAQNPVLASFNGDPRFNDRFTVTISDDHRRRAKELEKRYLNRIRGLDPATLNGRDRITWEIFLEGRVQALEGAEYPDHLLPVNQFFGVPNLLARMGEGSSFQPFDTVQDHENWLERLNGWPGWVDQAIANMREGMARGIVQPRVIMERVQPQLQAQITSEPEDSVFFKPIRTRTGEFSGEQRQRLSALYKSAIREKVVPGYRKLHDFIRDEYLPKTRKTAGLSALPGGPAWYAHEVRRNTSTTMTPKEIHEIGVAEVARISAEIRKARRRKNTRPSGAKRSFDSAEDMLDSYRALRRRVHAALPKLFAEFPESDYEIRAVEPFRQATAAGGSYMAGSPDGSRPGVFYVNTSNWRSRSPIGNEALFLHEAMPGHHFQISIQRESGDLPRFRRFGGFTAYTEGWALYVESLGPELGLYRDRDQYVAALQSELFRAKRLVVDTGIHALGWSRERAIDYLGSVREVERYMVLPGQALAYKIGQLEILELKRRAKERLGKDFDIRAFHSAILSEGAMPLSVLESRIDRWIDEHATPDSPPPK